MTVNGTNKTGFMRGDQGPFRCDNCRYWRAPVGCAQSQVVADPEVPKIKSPNGELLGEARADDCCKLFEPLRPQGITDTKFEDVGL